MKKKKSQDLPQGGKKRGGKKRDQPFHKGEKRESLARREEEGEEKGESLNRLLRWEKIALALWRKGWLGDPRREKRKG